MKNIDKIIHLKLVEITLMLVIIIISFPLWQKLNLNDVMTTAALYDNARYTYIKVENHSNGPMFPISDEEALTELTPSFLKLTNETNTSEDFTIMMKISKSSSIDYHCLNIAIDHQKQSLKNLYLFDDADNFYFSLKSDQIKGETKEYAFLIWMDATTGNEMMGKTLSYTFDLQEGILI